MKKLLLTLACSLMLALPAWAALVNINTATQAELEQLNGIGPKKAQAIIKYRKQHGAFKSINELEEVPGIGPTTLEKLRKNITVGNPNAAAAGRTAERKEVKEGVEKASKDKGSHGL